LPNAVRRVGGVSEAEQTYTLGPAEAFRLDACSFTIDYVNDGGFVIPTLIVRDSGGFTVAEIAAPSLSITPGSLDPFTYTGPATLTDDFSDRPPGGYGGYLLHDFGAGVTTSNVTVTWTIPPGSSAAITMQWLRSAGAVTLGPSVGDTTVENTDTATIALTDAVAAGDYLLLRYSYVSDAQLVDTQLPPPTVTGSVAGNMLDFSGHPVNGFAVVSAPAPSGEWVSSAVLFYRVVNALNIGDTVTLQLPGGQVPWLTLAGHDLAGLTVGNPVGPNAGGNYVALGEGFSASPTTIFPVLGVPKFTGAVLFNGVYTLIEGATADVMFARGGVESLTPFASGSFAPTHYVQCALPELHLGPRDTVTAASFDTLGPRDEDAIQNFLVWGVDE
jgi:hypothetical protein